MLRFRENTQKHIYGRTPIADDRPVAEELNRQKTTITKDDIHATLQFRTHKPSQVGAADPRLRERGQRDGQRFILTWLLRNENTILSVNCLLIILQRMITITTTKIILHPETSAAALSTIQCLTGSDTLVA